MSEEVTRTKDRQPIQVVVVEYFVPEGALQDDFERVENATPALRIYFWSAVRPLDPQEKSPASEGDRCIVWIAQKYSQDIFFRFYFLVSVGG